MASADTAWDIYVHALHTHAHSYVHTHTRTQTHTHACMLNSWACMYAFRMSKSLSWIPSTSRQVSALQTEPSPQTLLNSSFMVSVSFWYLRLSLDSLFRLSSSLGSNRAAVEVSGVAGTDGHVTLYPICPLVYLVVSLNYWIYVYLHIQLFLHIPSGLIPGQPTHY